MHNHTTAPLKNVALFNETLDRVMNRPAHLPGMATFHGFSGYGKTYSAIYGGNEYKAYYIEVGHSWSQSKFCEAILNELGIPPKGTISHKVDQIVEGLISEDRPLIIDEADFIVNKRFIELVREIHDKSSAPIILIGEELLPNKLIEWERFHNRVLDWVPAVPADMDDIRLLARLYCSEIQLSDDVFKNLNKICQGRVRRICVNLERINDHAKLTGLTTIGSADIQELSLFTGQPPQRRAA